ncbi:MAG TPA: phosphatase PAP2 family protein [Gaiellaceae bacterium]|nr:phosphatase PAP2 family protein [Gaiellaceae bacterium]
MLDPIFEGLTYAGSFGAIWLVLSLAIAGFSWRRPWLLARVGATILVAESVSGLLKERLGRDRPPLNDPDPATLVELPHTSSFPSGHATVAFACATALALAVPRLRWPLFTLAALIAFSRVYVGVHYPLDVLAGAVLGVALGFAVRYAGIGIRTLARARDRTER